MPAGKVPAGAGGRAAWRDTCAAGIYRLRTPAGAGVAAASLLRRSESDVAPRERMEAGGVVHAASPEAVLGNVPLRDPLLLLAFAVLLLEWALWVKRR